MSRVWILAAGVLALACTTRPLDEGDEAAEDSAASDDSSDEAGPSCEPEACASTCPDGYPDCGVWIGACDHGECTCASSCIACVGDEDCPAWHECYGDGCYPCGDRELAWASACTVELADFLPPLIPYVDLEVAGETVPATQPVVDCGRDPGSWGWVEGGEGETLELCPDACGAFESAGSLTLSWCPPAGPP